VNRLHRTFVVVLALGLVLPLGAQAFPWMIKHNYVGCQVCHVDPSGAGLLTAYGRAQTELLLQSQYGKPKSDGSVSASTGFLLGAVKLPDEVPMQAAVRVGAMLNRTAAPGSDARDSIVPLQMVTDLRVGYINDWLRASASAGVVIKRAQLAALFPRTTDDGVKLVAREFWAGASVADNQLLIRAGRMNLPFGLRNPEHTLWVRSATRTDTNEDQQYGLSVNFTGEAIRAEVMGVAGNFQIGPEVYREKGAVGFAEYAFAPNFAAGLQFLALGAGADVELRTRSPFRQAYGAFARYGLSHELALMAELDVLHYAAEDREGALGATGLIQADFEVVRGLHLMVTGEFLRDAAPDQYGIQRGGWVGLAWFAAQGVEVRLDGIIRQFPQGENLPDLSNLILLSQVNLYF